MKTPRSQVGRKVQSTVSRGEMCRSSGTGSINERRKPVSHMTATRPHFGSLLKDVITPDEILRDRLVFRIREEKVRERLLREAYLTLAKRDGICRAAESMRAQLKVVAEIGGPEVNEVLPDDLQ